MTEIGKEINKVSIWHITSLGSLLFLSLTGLLLFLLTKPGQIAQVKPIRKLAWI